ncbi:MAG: hypothetical protein LBI42_09755 [Chitinispirillales bacterium]|jgi:transcriptional regulator with XRE-family HTH domain|nr:hypothetical protein [Chitinispirillales bacterium]
METVFETFGNFAKEMRLKTGLTLRRFCEEFGYDNGNHSKLERGLSAPPGSEEKQIALAENLGLLKGSEEWHKFFDLAALCRGKLPPSILSDKQLVAKLPYIFRTIRGEKLDEEKLMELAQMIRET